MSIPSTDLRGAKSPFLRLCVPFILATSLAGCGSIPPPTPPDELSEFEKAGPYVPVVDRSALVAARLPSGPYRVTAGDILQLEMPVVMRALSPVATTQGPAAQVPAPHVCRVTSAGKITLPTVGEIDAASKTLEEIESAAVAAYHPKYTVHRPSVVATVRDHVTVKVSVVGAVTSPGIHSLTSDEKSLVGALMKAGGIVASGAGAIRIIGRPGDDAAKPIVLPVQGLNVAFADLALEGGETIEVLRLDPQVFTVVGLVSTPGTYPYPPGARFTLLHAIGFGGGLDIISRPRYVQVFRQDATGKILSATYDLDETWKVAAALQIKQGDIVAVVDTPTTQFRRFIAGLFTGGVIASALLRLDRD